VRTLADEPGTIRPTRMLLAFDALLWVAFAVVTALDLHPSFKGATLSRWGAVALALGIASVLVALVLLLARRSRFAYWFAVAFLAAMAIGAFFDQFGLPDLAFVVAIASPLALLLRDRPWYLARPRA
jgi:hypothetical protein